MVRERYRITEAIWGKDMDFYQLENDKHWGFYNVTKNHWIYLVSKDKQTI